jgi:uncharacterized membrane protein
MLEQIIAALKGLPPELTTVIISALPVAELRGGIPFAFAVGISPFKAFWLAAAGNLLPAPLLLFLLQPVSNVLRKLPILDRFFEWLFARTRRKSHLIEKYEALGLALFVAIPLPMTGMWTGAIAASLFKIPIKYSLPAIIAGVFIAGGIVSALCMTGMMVYGLNG